jgi:hypothetical protein
MAKSNLFLLLLLTATMFSFVSCENDEENGSSDGFYTFVENEIEVFKNNIPILLEINGSKNLSDVTLFIDSIQVPYTFIKRTDKDHYLQFSLPESLPSLKEVNIVQKNKNKEKQGLKLRIGITFSPSLFGNPSIGIQNMAIIPAENGQIFTVSRGMVLDPFKKVTFKTSGINTNYRPDIDYVFGSDIELPNSLDNKEPVIIATGRRLGVDLRDNTTYFYSSYEDSGHYLIQEFAGHADFLGSGYYRQNFTAAITDLCVDATLDNIYIIEEDKPNCIQKMSALQAPVIWAGSAGQSGSIDGVGTNARFENVVGMQRDNNNLYVAQKNVIRKITPDGTVSTLSAFEFQEILAFAVAPDNKIYVLDAKDRSKLIIIDADRSKTFSGRILHPINKGNGLDINTNNMAVSSDGTVYFRNYDSGGKNSSLSVLIPN